MPEDDRRSFSILADYSIIGRELSQSLEAAKGMRNIIIHQYEAINDEIVYNALKDRLPKDVEELLLIAEKPAQSTSPSP